MARHIPFTATPEEILDALFNHDTRGSGSSSPLDRDGSRGASAGRDVHICEPQARLGQPVAPSSSTVTSPAPRVNLNKEEECADSTWKPKLTTPNPATFVVRKRGLLFISKIAGTRSIANFLELRLGLHLADVLLGRFRVQRPFRKCEAVPLSHKTWANTHTFMILKSTGSSECEPQGGLRTNLYDLS